jgi:CHAT domain-containing protein/Tfp pilus assembly protein PilF
MHQLRCLALALGLIAARSPAQDVSELTAGVAVERELAAGQVHTWRLTLARGDFVHLTIEQHGIDVAAALAGPDGQERLAVDAMDDELRPETLVAIVDEAGLYTVTTRPAPKAGAAGRYVLRLERSGPASDADRARVEAERAFERGRSRRSVNRAATWPGALADFETARDRYQALGDRPGEMKALLEIGVTANYLARPDALAPVEQAEQVARALGDRPTLARVLRVAASVHALAGRLDKAAHAVAEATTINRAIGHRAAEAHSLNYAAILHRRMGDAESAIALYEQALPLARAAGSRAFEGSILGNLGVAWLNLGEPDKALEVFEQSLALARAAKDPRGEQAALANVAAIHRDRGDHAKGLELFQQSLALARASGDPQLEVKSLHSIGLAWFRAGDYARALDYQRQSLAMARQLGDVSGQGSALRSVGRALAGLERRDEAVAPLLEALAIRRRTRERFGERDTLADLARVERERGNLDAALAWIRQSVDLDDVMRAEITSPELRTTFVAGEQDKYELLIDVLQALRARDGARGHDRTALEVSERARARALLDALLEARVDLRAGIDPSLLDRERALQQQLTDAAAELSRRFGEQASDERIAAAAQTVEGLTAAYQALESQIRRESPRYAGLTQPQPLSAGEIQHTVLDEDTVLLEIALGDERSWLWAVTPRTVTSVELPPRATIETAARSLYEQLTARLRRPGEGSAAYARRVAIADARLARASARVSRMLLGGIAQSLATEWRGRRLVIVAAGALEYLPFAVLPAPGRTPAAPLIASHEIVTVPSASVLALLRRETAGRARASRMLAILADPVFDAADPRLAGGHVRNEAAVAAQGEAVRDGAPARQRFSRLPFSRAEATAIATLAGRRHAFVALDFAASRAAVLGGDLRPYRIVHFATHGIVDSRRPALSGLILSLFDERGAPQNGYLRLHDIYNMRLDADLVVLSACRTALGREIKGEGLVGLTRAFMYAGAPRVVASLWPVSDRATAELMTRFYRGVLRQRLAPAAALRAAQRQLSRDPRWSAPYYWAGFVLQGDWKP